MPLKDYVQISKPPIVQEPVQEKDLRPTMEDWKTSICGIRSEEVQPIIKKIGKRIEHNFRHVQHICPDLYSVEIGTQIEYYTPDYSVEPLPSAISEAEVQTAEWDSNTQLLAWRLNKFHSCAIRWIKKTKPAQYCILCKDGVNRVYTLEQMRGTFWSLRTFLK
jgi:hypothetical protein